MATVFTKILQGDLPGHFVYRGQGASAFLSINPIRPGHTLVVPHAEVSHWLDLSPELHDEVQRLALQVGRAIREAFRPARVGMMIAGFEVPHTHLHVVPLRTQSDLSFANAASSVDHEELASIAADLKARMADPEIRI